MDAAPPSVFQAYDSISTVAKKKIYEFCSALEDKLISLARREIKVVFQQSIF